MIRFAIGKTAYVAEAPRRFPITPNLAGAAQADGKAPDAWVWDDLVVQVHRRLAVDTARIVWPARDPGLLSQVSAAGRCAIREDRLEELASLGRIRSRTDTAGALRELASDASREIRRLPDVFRVTWTERSLAYRVHSKPSPTHRASSVSVIVNFRDRPELMRDLLKSLASQTARVPVELVLVNNQSTPGNLATVKALARELLPEAISVLHLDYDRAFNHSAQCNAGAIRASGEVLVMMNNDARFVERETLQSIADWASTPGVASAGPRIVDRGGRRVVSSGIEVFPEPDGRFGVRESETVALSASVHQTAGNTFACAAIARKVWEKLGGLREQEFPTQYNDADFALRALEGGLRHVNIGAVSVIHEPGASEPRTREIIAAKHRKVCDAHPRMAEFAELQPRRERFSASSEAHGSLVQGLVGASGSIRKFRLLVIRTVRGNGI